MSRSVAGAEAEAQHRRTPQPESRCTLTDPVLPLSSPGTSWYQPAPMMELQQWQDIVPKTTRKKKEVMFSENDDCQAGSAFMPSQQERKERSGLGGSEDIGWKQNNYPCCCLPLDIKLPPHQIKKVLWFDLFHRCLHFEAQNSKPKLNWSRTVSRQRPHV